MGILDKVVGKITKAETLRIPYSRLAEIVRDEFITGKDDEYLNKVLKVAKGGFAITKEMKSENQRYDFHVGARPYGLIWLAHKPAWIFDNQENKFYQLDKDSKWKKFYGAVKDFVNTEKINRKR